ncbi:MAG TPA: PilZ domain-containing protein [Thermoanaerobaculaceae bacterium]|nr:PilZ domain-containing protein [Thermoanaerobaculaceae bacterium]HRS16721.1 PilZ domain-containing protein [Thermoanaerobaculaceae bacterium]
MLERRRAPRYNVKDVSAALLATVEGRITAVRADGLTIETARQVRLDRACTVRLRTAKGQTVRVHGHIASCRLGEVRTLPSGRTVSVYEAEVAVAEDGGHHIGAADLQETVVVEFSYDALVRNMSPYGALVETELPLLVGSSSTISIRSPEAAVTVGLSVVFSRELIDPAGNRAYQLGVEFTGVDQAQREALTKLVFGAMA